MFFFFQTYFYHKKSLLRLLIKTWIWYRCQNRIENYYHHNGVLFGSYKKVHIRTQSKKEGCSCQSCNLYIARNEWLPIYLAKTAPSPIAYSTWRNFTQRNLNWTGKLQVTHLYFLKEIVFAQFQRLFGRSNRDVFLQNEGKIHEGGCVKEFFSLTCRLASRNFIIDYLFTDNFQGF